MLIFTLETYYITVLYKNMRMNGFYLEKIESLCFLPCIILNIRPVNDRRSHSTLGISYDTFFHAYSGKMQRAESKKHTETE